MTSGITLAICMLHGLPAYSQPTNDKLLTFQKFVNGEVPVKEAVVYRTLAKTNGVIFNKQWWRFACQDDTWYCQQLAPDPNNPTNLIPLGLNGVCGKSFTSFWTINNSSIFVADKNFARDSHLDYVFERFLVFSALSLGIPRNVEVLNIEDSYIEWDNLQFRSVIVKRDKSNKTVGTLPAQGRLNLRIDGAPFFSEHAEAGEYPAGKTFYYYTSLADDIPTELTSTNANFIVSQKFILLKLGKVDLKETGGFVPSMFADMKLHRDVEMWTNGQSYNLVKGKLVSNFGVIPVGTQKGFGKLIILLCLLTVTSIFLGLWYWSSKKPTKPTK